MENGQYNQNKLAKQFGELVGEPTVYSLALFNELSFTDLLEQAEANLNSEAEFAYQLGELAEARARQLGDSEKLAKAKSLKGASLYKQDKAREAIQELSQAKKLAEAPMLRCEILNRLAYSHSLIAEYKLAIVHSQEALKVANGLMTKEWSEQQAFSFNVIGIAYQKLGVYDAAIAALLKGLDVVEDDNPQKGHLTSNLSLLQQSLGNLDEAFKYCEKALEIAIYQKDNRIQASVLGNIGYTHLLMGNYEDAISFAKDSLSLEHISIEGRLNQFLNLAQAYRKLNNYAETEKYIQYAKGVLEEHPQDFIRCELLHCEAQVFYLQHRYIEAEKAIVEARKLAEKTNNLEELFKIHYNLSMVYERMGRTVEALEHHKAFHRVKEQVHNRKAERRVEGLMIQHQVEELIQEKELTIEENTRLEQLVHQRTIEIEEAHMEMLERLAIAGEKRDDDTGEHTARVGRVCGLIAKELGCDEIYVDNIRIAARLHDIGKIGVPDSILLKPQKLTVAEFEIIKTHTTIGTELLADSKSKIFQMAERIAGTHHERWDGSGYPNGIAGADIPLEGRIVAVADVYDALTNDRPYKDTWTHEAALQELFDSSDSHLDRKVVEAFSRLFEKGIITAEDLREKPKEKVKIVDAYDQEIFS